MTKKIKRNNPLNIRYDGKSQWQGLCKNQQSLNGFCNFCTPAYGLRAALVLFRTYRETYNITTVDDFIYRWAPPAENDYKTYVHNIHYSMIKAAKPYETIKNGGFSYKNGNIPSFVRSSWLWYYYFFSAMLRQEQGLEMELTYTISDFQNQYFKLCQI